VCRNGAQHGPAGDQKQQQHLYQKQQHKRSPQQSAWPQEVVNDRVVQTARFWAFVTAAICLSAVAFMSVLVLPRQQQQSSSSSSLATTPQPRVPRQCGLRVVEFMQQIG